MPVQTEPGSLAASSRLEAAPRHARRQPEGAAARSEAIAQAIVLSLAYCIPAIFWARTNGIHDPDIWWHLRTGQWILQHHALPRIDSFCSLTAGKPWQAYSWLFELLVFQLYNSFGLVGLVLYTCGLTVAITAALHHLVRQLQRDFSIAVLLTLAGAMCLSQLYSPRPWLFTILFFVVELDLLLQARRTGRTRMLLLLPILFALWANLHIQFLNGLVVLFLALGEAVVNQYVPRVANSASRLRPLPVLWVTLGCLAATCLNPYGVQLYRAAFELATQPGVADLIGELKAIPFRRPEDFLLLLLAMSACAALARARRTMLFETALFVYAAFLAFRSQRDLWLLAIVSVAMLAAGISIGKTAVDRTTALTRPLALLAAILAVVASFRVLHVDNPNLRTQLEVTMPVKAVEFLRQKQYPGPLYNDFNWGGYLIWNLRVPVSIDGRAALQGTEHIQQSVNTISAQPGWADDPQLKQAGVVLLPVSDPLAQMLALDSRFRQVYRDKLAVVFVSRPRTR